MAADQQGDAWSPVHEDGDETNADHGGQGHRCGQGTCLGRPCLLIGVAGRRENRATCPSHVHALVMVPARASGGNT